MHSILSYASCSIHSTSSIYPSTYETFLKNRAKANPSSLFGLTVYSKDQLIQVNAKPGNILLGKLCMYVLKKQQKCLSRLVFSFPRFVGSVIVIKWPFKVNTCPYLASYSWLALKPLSISLATLLCFPEGSLHKLPLEEKKSQIGGALDVKPPDSLLIEMTDYFNVWDNH